MEVRHGHKSFGEAAAAMAATLDAVAAMMEILQPSHKERAEE